MRRENDKFVKKEESPDWLPYVRPVSWVVGMEPLSLLAGSMEEREDYDDGGAGFDQEE